MAATGNTTRIENALLYRLSTLVLDPVRRIAQPGDSFTPIVGEIYLAPGVLWNRSERGEIGGSAARRHIGILQVNVRGPALSASPEPLAEVADAIIEWFDLQVVTRNSVTVRIGSFTGGPGVPWRGGVIIDAGWALIPVSIPFWCDVFPE
jgi:hypothetical protein